jgi:DNA polymerase I-like protein with 3'-5' exonuclease and polymerase domains
LFWDEPEEPKRKKSKRTKEDIQFLFQHLTWENTPNIVSPLIELPPGPVAIDFETKDPTLQIKGPAWSLPGVNEGRPLGLAIAYKDPISQKIISHYYPRTHISGNCEYDVEDWLIHHFKRTDLIWVCHHASYDIGVAYRYITGCYPKSPIVDTQHMAAILDEYRISYSLDNIAKDYLGEGKNLELIKRLMEVNELKEHDVKSMFEYFPGYSLAPYASDDSLRTLQLYYKMLPLIKEQDLLQIHHLESKLIPLCTEMQRRGIRIDVEKAYKLRETTTIAMKKVQERIKSECGVTVEPWEAESCSRALLTQGIICKLTSKTKKANVDVKLLQQHRNNKVARDILNLRKMSKVVTTFLDGIFLGYENNGRLHPSINQLKSERNDTEEGGNGVGAVSGRFSITEPALQTIPTRDPYWGPLMRELIVPDKGYSYIKSRDYSSQEPRLAVHFAALLSYSNSIDYTLKEKLLSAREMVKKYHENPKIDIHKITSEICNISRDRAKSIFLGKILYGMGGAKLSRTLGLPTEWKVIIDKEWISITEKEVESYRHRGYKNCLELAGKETNELNKRMNEGVPFAKALFDYALKVAQERGYVKSILGRRCRFINETGFHKALNKICQPSAADQTKQAMVNLWEIGIVPLLTIHDELLFNSNTLEEDNEPITEIMEKAIPLLVPSVVDMNAGRNWGEIKRKEIITVPPWEE